EAHVGLDNRFDRLDDVLRTEARADDLADRRLLVPRAAEGDLISLFSGALEAENADMADVMVAAGVDAARDLDLERADAFRAGAVAEFLGDALGDGNGARGGERAIVEPGAGDDVADRA